MRLTLKPLTGGNYVEQQPSLDQGIYDAYGNMIFSEHLSKEIHLFCLFVGDGQYDKFYRTEILCVAKVFGT